MKETLYVKKMKTIEVESVEKGKEVRYVLELSSGDGAVRGGFYKIDPFVGIGVGDTVEVRVTAAQATLNTGGMEPEQDA